MQAAKAASRHVLALALLNIFFTNEEMSQTCLTEYFPHDWRLFIDSSKRSLKCVLLHNGNKLDSIPIAHSTKMKEDYNNIFGVGKDKIP